MNAAPPLAPLPSTVTDLDRYLFDLNGYLVVPDMLDPDQVARLTAILEGECAKQEQAHPGRQDFGIQNLLHISDELRALIDHEPIMPYLTEWLGDGFRLDHEYALVMRPRCLKGGAPHIHGGGTPYCPQSNYTFQQGRIICRETAVSYALTDVNPGDGGMGVIPGSHKSNFPLPWAADPGPYTEEQVRSGFRSRPAPAIIFTESLSHCTRPWAGQGHRRALFYKYTPRLQQLGRNAHERATIPGLTERQRRILEPAHK